LLLRSAIGRRQNDNLEQSVHQIDGQCITYVVTPIPLDGPYQRHRRCGIDARRTLAGSVRRVRQQKSDGDVRQYGIFALPGLFVYSACWYAVIFRYRDYSLYRTMLLVVATFGAVSAVVAALMMVGGFYVAITMLLAVAQPWKLAPALVVAPLAYAFMTAMGAIFLIVPYVIVATPMALLHRWLLLKLFAWVGPAAPAFGAGPS
jgi:hypothetical protein